MNDFNPLLGDWLAPPEPAQALSTDSVSALLLHRGDLEQIYGQAGSPVADAFDVFRTSELSQMGAVALGAGTPGREEGLRPTRHHLFEGADRRLR